MVTNPLPRDPKAAAFVSADKVPLSVAQRIFTKLQAEFVTWAFENGFELTDGDAFRDARVHGELGVKQGYGHSRSAHKQRLARDWNLFINERYTGKTEDYQKLGEKWESMHPSARWGGRFADGNHFSFERNGIK